MGGIVVELAVTDVATIVPLELLPLSSMGFGWIVFALMGALVGMVVGPYPGAKRELAYNEVSQEFTPQGST